MSTNYVFLEFFDFLQTKKYSFKFNALINFILLDQYQAHIKQYTDSKPTLDPPNVPYTNYSQPEKLDSTSVGLNSYQVADEKRREDRKVPSLLKDALKEHSRRRAGGHVRYENVKKTRKLSNSDDIL